jgi:hypothetical protein
MTELVRERNGFVFLFWIASPQAACNDRRGGIAAFYHAIGLQ